MIAISTLHGSLCKSEIKNDDNDIYNSINNYWLV